MSDKHTEEEKPKSEGVLHHLKEKVEKDSKELLDGVGEAIGEAEFGE